MKDLTKSLKESILSRLSGPFGGAFFITWIVYNWKIWYTGLFYDKGVLLHTRIKLLESHLDSANYMNLYIYPLLISLAFSLLYPWISGVLTFLYNKGKLFQNSMNLDYMEKNKWSFDDVQKMVKEQTLDIEKEKDDAIRDLDTQKRQLDASQKQATDLTGKLAKTQKTISDYSSKNEKNKLELEHLTHTRKVLGDVSNYIHKLINSNGEIDKTKELMFFTGLNLPEHTIKTKIGNMDPSQDYLINAFYTTLLNYSNHNGFLNTRIIVPYYKNLPNDYKTLLKTASLVNSNGELTGSGIQIIKDYINKN